MFFLSLNLFSIEPKDFNGGWLNINAYNLYQEGDEFLVDQIGTITIEGKEYIYCFSGSVVDLSSNAPRFCITYFRDFDVISIKRLSDTTFEVKLRSRHNNEMIGNIKLTMKDFETFYFDIIDGSDLFKNEIKNFTIENKCYFKKLQKI